MVEAPSFAAGGGKIGVLLREHDWSRTPLLARSQPGLKPCEPQSAWSSTRSCRSSFSGARTVS